MNGRMPVYAEECVLGWRLIRRISFERGERMVDAGVAERCFDDSGRHVAFRVINRGRERSASPNSPTAITMRECEIYAGRCFPRGQSRTARMSEVQRLTRINPRDGRRLPPEDAIECVTAKVSAVLALQRASLRALTVFG